MLLTLVIHVFRNMSMQLCRETEKLIRGAAHEEEEEWQDLWRTCFRQTAIVERKNFVQQRNFMPKRFWKYLTEMKKSK